MRRVKQIGKGIIHEKKKEFKCDICNGEFGYQSKLKEHILIVHPRENEVTQTEDDTKYSTWAMYVRQQ